MAVHNLPAFKKEGARFPRPDRPREWVEQQGSLKDLGQSLQVEEEPFADPDEPIRAIPDPWAQSRTFAEALVDPEHSMHATFVAQWRGLLALLALRLSSEAGYSIDHRPLELGDTHIFDRVLSRLHPQFAIGDAVKLWTRPGIVYVTAGGRKPAPIAMLNPACLISPGRFGSALTIPNVPWARNGLADPLALEGDEALANASLVVLATYLENLRAKLGALKQSDVGDQIRERLQDYLDETNAILGVSPLAARVGAGFSPELDPVYQSLWASVTLGPVANPAATSECRLVLKGAGGHGALKGIILVDPSLARLGGRSARDILVWGVRPLSEMINSPPIFDAVKREAAEHGYLVITADDLFTPRAAALRGNPRIHGHGQSTKAMLLPVRPIALLLESSLPTMVEADVDVARASVSLKVKLERETGPVSHTLTRHYREGEAGGEGLFVPDADWAIFNAAVWPDFKTSAWDAYFARLNHQNEIERIQPRIALSHAIVSAALQLASDGQQAVFALANINAGHPPATNQPWFRIVETVTEGESEQLQTTDRGFEAIFYLDVDEDRGEASIGCVWLDIKTVETRLVDSTPVAVDFGTTNTVACFGDGKPIRLQQRLVNPIGFDDSAKLQQQRTIFRWQFVDFLPPNHRDLPTPTVAIEHKVARRETTVPLARNVIYFNPPPMIAQGGTMLERAKYQLYFSRCLFNLKWNNDPEHVVAASDFLSQLIMMIAAEKAANGVDPRSLKWRFSLPDGMTGRTRSAFEQHLTLLTERMGSLDGLYSEGLAAAKYMLAGNSGAKVAPGTINAILDIGGGTTDITLWALDEPLWRGSFRLAGQAFFTQAFIENRNLLKEIGLEEWAELLNPSLDAESIADAVSIAPEDVPHLAELLFSEPTLSQAMDKHWSLKLNLSTGDVLRAAALVFLGGIAYYLGLVARQLIEEKLLKPEQLSEPAFALCGRGAGLFGRMHNRLKPNAASDVTNVLTLFSRAAKAEPAARPRLFLEPEPKLEVIRGMVTPYANIDARVDAHREPLLDHLPAGIRLGFRGGRRIDPRHSVHEAIADRKVTEVDITPIDEMLEWLKEETGIRIDLNEDNSEGAHAAIRNEVRVAIDRARDEDDNTRFEEPPFISALRVLIGEVTGAGADSEKRLTIEVKP